MTKRKARLLRALVALLLGVFLVGALRQDPRGALELVTLDGDQPTPARIELLDEKRQACIAEDALLIGGD